MPTATSQEGVSALETLGEVAIPDLAIGLREHPLWEQAASHSLASGIGRIVLAGSASSGGTWVQFNLDGGGGYASSWPSWAFSIAKDAVLHNVKVWVVSDGDPFGSNLRDVLLYAP